MKEISNETRAIETHERAKSYFETSEQFAYKFLMEIKVLRDEKLYKELNFKNFEDYTINNFGYTRETISNRIQDAEAWGKKYDEALRHYGKTKARQLGIMPESERKKIIKKGIETDSGIKRVDEATTREIEEYQKKLKEKESQLERAQHSEQVAIKKLEREQNKKPKVIREPYVPEDYQQLEESERRLKNENRQLSSEINDLKKNLDKLKEFERVGYEADQLRASIKQLDRKKAQINNILDANDKLTDLEKEFHEFFDANMSPLKYKPLINELYEFNGTERMKGLVNLARAWVDDMDRMLPSENRKIIEGEIIND